MFFYFIDDSKIKGTPHTRPVDKLFAVGGLVVDGDKVKSVEDELKDLCSGSKYGVPSNENIKWSPSRTSWLNCELDGPLRQELFADILDCLVTNQCCAIVAISDQKYRKANSDVSTHEIDATLLALERYNTWLGNNTGVVCVSKPGGGTSDSNKFVSEYIAKVSEGTTYVKFKQLALAPIVMPAKHSRMLQAADLIVSITNSKVAGGNPYADSLFDKILELMPSSLKGVKGGVGLKVHPSFIYRNLYHWLLGDEHYVQGSTGLPLPDADRPYAKDQMKY